MRKDYKTAIGMMSGTSLDAIDACLLNIDEDFNFNVLCSHSLEYPNSVKRKLLKLANNKADVKDVCNMDFVVGHLFARCANELIEKTRIDKSSIEFISSHGQTIWHNPKKIKTSDIRTGSTLQIGNISVISELTGITTVGDFRSKDIGACGQGAPLVPFADELIFKKIIPRAIQNIGGIGNVTVLSEKCETFAFDTGPGNMLIDYFVQKLFDKPFDEGGKIALQGKVDEKWLSYLLKEPYYSQKPPKSTGRELFNTEYAKKIYKHAPKNNYDVIASITALTAKTISNAYKKFVFPKTEINEIVLGGGGAFNQALIKFLKEEFEGIKIKTHKDFGIEDKLKEAIAFAMLGFCTIYKKTNNLPSCTGAKKRVIMGVVSYS